MKSPSEPSSHSGLTAPCLQEAPGASGEKRGPGFPARGGPRPCVHWFARLEGGSVLSHLLPSAWFAGFGCLSGTCPRNGGCPLLPAGRGLCETCGGARRASQAPSVSWRSSPLPLSPCLGAAHSLRPLAQWAVHLGGGRKMAEHRHPVSVHSPREVAQGLHRPPALLSAAIPIQGRAGGS